MSPFLRALFMLNLLGAPALCAEPMANSLAKVEEKSSAVFSLTHEQFLSPSFEAAEHPDFNYIGAQFIQNAHGLPGDHFVAEIEGQFSPGLPMMSYLNVTQLAWQDHGFTVGRKKILWSRLDETWKLGLYQPLFRWNPVAASSQGLSGLFLETDSSAWGIKLFASFLNIPDQGPGYELKDGKFERANPWFQSPPRYVHFLGQTDQVNYDLQKTQTNDIIFNQGFVGQMYFGDSSEGLFFQTSMAHKPANQLALGFDGFLTPDNKAQIQINPKIFYQNLLSTEFSYSQKLFSGGLTGLVEKPEAPQYEDNLTYVVYRPSSILSPFVEFRNLSYRANISYLKVSGGEGELLGGLAPGPSGSGAANNAILPMRYPYQEATQVVVSGEQNLKRKRSLQESIGYLEGVSGQFSQWSLQGDLQWGPQYRFNVSAHFLKAAETADAEKTLIGQYQNNDDLYLGVSYVF